MLEIISDLWSDWSGRFFLAIIIVLMALLLLLVFVVTDNCTGAWGETASGQVASKEYHASYYTTTFIMVGKVMVPMQQYHPPEYLLIVREPQATVPCSEEEYGQISEGQTISFQSKAGGLSGSVCQRRLIR